jgi:hypothetical protein
MDSHTVRPVYATFNKVGKGIDQQECAAFYVLARERIYADSIGMTCPKGASRFPVDAHRTG